MCRFRLLQIVIISFNFLFTINLFIYIYLYIYIYIYIETTFRRKDYVPRRQMLYVEVSKNVSPMWYPCRGNQSCAAEVTKTPPTCPKYLADASKDFADASKDFADASTDFTADVVTLPTRPVTTLSMASRNLRVAC